MRKLHCPIALVVSCFAGLALGDTVYLRSGAKLSGRVLDASRDGVTLGFEGGGRMRIDARLVAAVARDAKKGPVVVAAEREGGPPKAAREAEEGPRVAGPETPPPPQAPSKAIALTDREVAIAEALRASEMFPPIEEALRKRIEAAVYDLTRWRSRNRVRAERHLKAMGPVAVPWVIAVARHPFELTRRAALRILSAYGDLRAIPIALVGLEDDDPFVREKAAKLLREFTGRRFGFRAEADARVRARAVRRWRRYLEGLLERAEAALGARATLAPPSVPVVA